MKILVIDNYDSFTFNLVHSIQALTKQKIDIKRNDEMELDDIEQYDKIVLSPGPGIPDEAGKLKEIIARYSKTKSIFGVCLGMQAIAEVFKGSLVNMKEVYHGIASDILIHNNENVLFKNLPEKITGGRYHSWIVDRNSLPECFEITASDSYGHVMAISHKEYDVHGVQFHPESILTEEGEKIIANWLNHNSIEEIELPSASNSRFSTECLKSNFIFC